MTNSKITVKFPQGGGKSTKTPSRGRIMDFAPRQRTVTSAPRPPRATAQPAAPRAVRPTPVRKPAAKLRPLSEHQVVTLRRRPQATPRQQPTPTPKIKPLGEYKDLDNYTDFDDLTLGIIEDMDEPLDQRIENQPSTPVETPAQDQRNFFLPGKSPFINTEKLEKRPLSAFRPDTQLRKNNYTSRLSEAQEGQDVPTLVTTSASHRTNFGLIVAILLTIILGAAVGAIAYLAFFQD